MNLIKLIKDFISPKKCYSCNTEWHFLCSNCFEKIEDYFESCYICKGYSENNNIHTKCKKNIYFDKIIVLKHYVFPIIKKLIIDSKFYWKKDILEDFSYYLWKKLLKNIWDLDYKKSDYIIISVPMYFLKKYKRWYNVSEILSKNISKNVWVDYNKNIIIKKTNNSQQSKLKWQERIKNIQNAFKINKKELDKIDKKVFIIVDDVISTWSTINEISKILKEAWVKNIIWLIIASD